MTGRFGERGAYQFRRATWRLHTRASFDLAHNRAVANSVAHRHYLWIISRLDENGIPATPYNIACAWNAGAGNVARGTLSRAAREYGESVSNLTLEALRRQLPSVKPKPLVIKLESFVSDGTTVRLNLATRPLETPDLRVWRPEPGVQAAVAQLAVRRPAIADASPAIRPVAPDTTFVALIFAPTKG